jgi:hypothetical protein
VDIIFPGFPCSILSLDKQDAVHSHTVDVEENLLKTRLGADGRQIGTQDNLEPLGFQSRVEAIRQQYADKEGCRLAGNFTVKMVPGNFHISVHHFA